jgi:hypothetical protein
MNLHRRHLKEGQRHMIGARWANAEGGGDRMSYHPAHAQGGEEMTVTKASKALKVGERGIFHAKHVIAEGTEEEIAAPQWEPRKPLVGTRKPRRGGNSSGAIDEV